MHGIQEATGYELNYGSCANKALYLLSISAIATNLNVFNFTGSLQSTGLKG